MAQRVIPSERNDPGSGRALIRLPPRSYREPGVLDCVNALNEENGADVEVVGEEDAELSCHVGDSQRMAEPRGSGSGTEGPRKVSPEEVEQLEALLIEAFEARDGKIGIVPAKGGDDCCCPCHDRGRPKPRHSLSNPYAPPVLQASKYAPDNSRPLSARLRSSKHDPEAFDFWGVIAASPIHEALIYASIPLSAAAAVFFWGSLLGFF